MSINSFSYDSTAKWDRYALSLPISRKDIVVSKYVVSVLLIICGAAISTILNILLSIYKNTFTTDVFIINYSILFVAVVYISILIPLIYKFGVEKSRILIFAVFFIPTIIVTLSSRLGISLPPVSTIELIIKISPLIMIAIFYSSFLISYKIYNDKEI
jgi:ABC-type transport system involved in multi-copper enzyme maturation permease subunit